MQPLGHLAGAEQGCWGTHRAGTFSFYLTERAPRTSYRAVVFPGTPPGKTKCVLRGWMWSSLERACLAHKGLGLVPAQKREERYPRKSETAHKLSTHQDSTPPDCPALAWKHLSSGQVEAEVWKEHHPAEKGREVSGPLQGHGCRSVSNLSHRCFSL